MTKVPFHRRVFLWVIVVAFFILAPAVVFYTSGFRWNAKKGIIERNGTLILDTHPPGASVSLNGETIPQKTPITLQNAAPGTYRIRLEFPGYAAWEKTLDVRASLVTFVNDVRLWRNGTPSFAWDRPTTAIASSPNARILATVEDGTDGKRTLVFRDIPATGDIVADPVASSATIFHFENDVPTGTVRLVWNDANSAVLISDELNREWLADRSGSARTALLLPSGAWRWTGGTLVGIRTIPEAGGLVRHERSEITTKTGAAQLTMLSAGVSDQDGTYSVEAATGTLQLSVVELGRSGRRFELPAGDWTIAHREGDWLFLTDGNEWLGFEPSNEDSPFIRIPADAPPQFTKRGRDTAFLSYGGGELWEGALGQSPDLLLRASEPIIGASWHREGNYVFYATTHDIVALGLDARDGRSRNTLATFDRISGFTVAGSVLYVAGDRDGKSGVWRLDVE